MICFLHNLNDCRCELYKKLFPNKLNDLMIIKSKFNDLLKKLNIPYFSILWPPVVHIFAKIENELESVENGIKIVKSNLVTLTFNEFEKFLYEVYKNGDIEKYKIDKKYNSIINSCIKSEISLKKVKLKIFEILLNYPNYKIKIFNGNPRSKTTMKIKKQIRDNNKDLILDYYYDNIIHMTDNIYQNIEVGKIV